jgi:hypothetical protein
MAKVYPTKIDLFLAAESLRQELGGKITIIGAFAGGHILLASGTSFPAHMPLGILIAFYEGEGNFKARLRMSDAHGKQLGQDVEIGSIEKFAEQPMQLMVNFGIFELTGIGKYKIDAFLDDRAYTDYLTISVSDKPFT